jgi:hypothetical protein
MALTPDNKRPSPESPPLEDPGSILKATSPSVAVSLDEFLASPTPLTDDAVAALIAITRDYLKYGGNFYSHLTGKDLLLEKNVDFKIRYDRSPAGEIDMDSYREARQKKINEWLAKEENQIWLTAAQKFHEEHASEISYGHEAVVFKSSDGSTGPKSRFTTNLFYSDSWIYYESNKFIKQSQRFAQPEREAHKYRVYFSVGGADVISTFSEIIDTLKNSEQIQRYGFQIKAVDLYRPDNIELGRVIHQKDRLVLYLGENSMKAAFPLLQRYAEQNKDKLSRPGILFAKPIIDGTGQPITGVTITSSVKGYSPDPTSFPKEYKSFNDMQSSIVESCLKSIVAVLKKPSMMLLMTGPFPRIRWEMERISPQASTDTFLRTILKDEEGGLFLAKYLKQVYPQWATAYGLRENNTAFKKE